MGFKLNNDHPTFLLTNKIQEISNNFLNQFGFNYFQYLRCYNDGSFSLLTNHIGLLEFVQQFEHSPVIYSSLASENKNAHSFWFLWDESLPKYPVEIARKKFNLHNGLTLVKRCKTYYDMIAVALAKEQANPALFYMNKLKAIEFYIRNFEIDNQDLIKLITKNPIALLEAQRDVNYKHLCLSNGKIEVLGKHGKSYITTQELTCLRLKLQGTSYKEMAQTLNLSVRTIETYINRVKERTGYETHLALEHMLT